MPYKSYHQFNNETLQLFRLDYPKFEVFFNLKVLVITMLFF